MASIDTIKELTFNGDGKHLKNYRTFKPSQWDSKETDEKSKSMPRNMSLYKKSTSQSTPLKSCLKLEGRSQSLNRGSTENGRKQTNNVNFKESR